MNRRSQVQLRGELVRPHRGRPFWLSAKTYYVISIVASVLVFFAAWILMSESGETVPYVGASLVAVILLASAVLIREVILRMHENSARAERARLDKRMRAALKFIPGDDVKKISLEQNKAWLGYIRTKSDAAKVLAKIADAHREVFELCENYLNEISQEMPNVTPGSPRIGAFRKGTDRIQAIHEYHLIKWAKIESSQFVAGSAYRGNINDTLAVAGRAESAIRYALDYYPNNADLVASHAVVRNARRMVEAAELTNEAESAKRLGDLERALILYNDALKKMGPVELLSGSYEESIVERLSAEVSILETRLNVV